MRSVNIKKEEKGRETHPLWQTCDYKFAVDASDLSATWCVPPLIYCVNNTALETRAAWYMETVCVDFPPKCQLLTV